MSATEMRKLLESLKESENPRAIAGIKVLQDELKNLMDSSDEFPDEDYIGTFNVLEDAIDDLKYTNDSEINREWLYELQDSLERDSGEVDLAYNIVSNVADALGIDFSWLYNVNQI